MFPLGKKSNRKISKQESGQRKLPCREGDAESCSSLSGIMVGAVLAWEAHSYDFADCISCSVLGRLMFLGYH